MTNDEGALQREAMKAEEAKRILETPAFKEACNRIDTELRVMRESVGMNDRDMHTRLILAEQMWGKLLDHLKATMMAGDYARHQLKLRESRAEHIREAIRNGIRR